MGVYIKGMVKHPAKFTSSFIPAFASILIKYGCKKVLDPFAGTGKIAEIKKHGFAGVVFANDIESDWIMPNEYGCDVISCMDSENLIAVYGEEFFDAICTSPTYGNRMADHHNAKDGSKRNTYTHCIGHELQDGNTGKMQWGSEYKEKHEALYKNICQCVKPSGIFILNISNHIRKGEEIDVCGWHIQEIVKNGFSLVDDISIKTNRNRFGANSDKRVECEHIYVFQKHENRKEMNDEVATIPADKEET